MKAPNLIQLTMVGIVACLLWMVYLTLYYTQAPLFSRWEDGSYCAMYGTPWQECDCTPGWPCDDSTPIPEPVLPGILAPHYSA